MTDLTADMWQTEGWRAKTLKALPAGGMALLCHARSATQAGKPLRPDDVVLIPVRLVAVLLAVAQRALDGKSSKGSGSGGKGGRHARPETRRKEWEADLHAFLTILKWRLSGDWTPMKMAAGELEREEHALGHVWRRVTRSPERYFTDEAVIEGVRALQDPELVMKMRVRRPDRK